MIVRLQQMSTNHQDQFFLLIQRVGSKGKYQRNIFLLFCGIWFIIGFLILSIGFLFITTSFICPNQNYPHICKQWVCRLGQQQRVRFEVSNRIKSMLEEFGKYQCVDQSMISDYKTMLFLGILGGAVIYNYLEDDFRRRRAIIISWSTISIGLIILCLSHSIQLVCLGLFIAGIGCQPSIRISLVVINQVVEHNLRQAYSLLLQGSIGVAGIALALSYYTMQQWRIITTIFCCVPSLIILAAIIWQLQQTPGLIVKTSKQNLLNSLMRIANTNGLQCDITLTDIQSAYTSHLRHRAQNRPPKQFSFLDLYKYKSLRTRTIMLSIIIIGVSCLFFGPTSVISSFNIDYFLLQFMLSVADCLSCPLACYFIASTQRKKTSIKCFFMVMIFLLIGHFAGTQEHCISCLPNLIKLSMIMAARFCLSYYYGIFFLYINQLYPLHIRNVGFGTISVVGAFGGVIIQKLLANVSALGQDYLMFMSLLALICVWAARKLPQTQGNGLEIQIQQLKKQRVKKRYEPSFEQSLGDLQLHTQGQSIEESVEQTQTQEQGISQRRTIMVSQKKELQLQN